MKYLITALFTRDILQFNKGEEGCVKRRKADGQVQNSRLSVSVNNFNPPMGFNVKKSEMKG